MKTLLCIIEVADRYNINKHKEFQGPKSSYFDAIYLGKYLFYFFEALLNRKKINDDFNRILKQNTNACPR